ncbi:hypothetical protein D3C79_698100 [compost metagenome]
MGDVFEDTVLFYALTRRLAVGHRIARSAVQQTVVTASGAGGDIMALQQYATQATARAVTGNTRPGCTAANDYHIRFAVR